MKLALTLAIIAGGIGIATAAAWKVTTIFPTPTCSGLGHCPVEPHDQGQVGYDCRTVKSGTLKPDREICVYR